MTNPVVERLRRHGVRPRKELGQHFLIDPHAIERIAERVAPGPGTPIVELGAGTGVLTERLLDAGARVVAVELDDDLARILAVELGGRAGFTLLHVDLAAIDLRALRRELGAERLHLTGNLPYQLTSTVLFGLLELEDGLADAVLMVQREVAERIVAPHGSRVYGITSVLLRAYHDVRIEARFKPGAFLPPPRVESALIRIAPKAGGPALPWGARAPFTHLVKSVFNERRKVLRNTLKKFYGLDAGGLEACEAGSGIDLGRRPESLRVEEFVQLLHALPANAVVAPEG
jgi:16S rRNA (adenine1518-N6/adenine1519-N6)-dimethyltransferase